MRIHPTRRGLCLTGLVIAALAAGTVPGAAQVPLPTGDALRIKIDAEFATVSAGARVILRYRYEHDPRPFLEALYTPKGVPLLLEAPTEHAHHRGLMYAATVNGVNFWSDAAQVGKIVHQTIHAGNPRMNAGFMQDLEWRSPEGKSLLAEHRTVWVWGTQPVVDAGAVLFDWRMVLEPAPGAADVELTDDRDAGLGLRFVTAAEQDVQFIAAQTPTSAESQSATVYAGHWCAYTANTGGKPVTVALFDHPGNPRPATWLAATTPYQRLAATLALHEHPTKLKAGESLRLVYGVAAWDGRIEPARIEQLYQLWLSTSPLRPASQPASQPATAPAQ